MINDLVELWCLVASAGFHFCVSSTSFQKIDISWPQQPPTHTAGWDTIFSHIYLLER